MKKISQFILSIGIIMLSFSLFNKTKPEAISIKNMKAYNIHSPKDIVALFPENQAEITNKTTKYLKQAQQMLDAVIAIAKETRTFKNTALALDQIKSLSDLSLLGNTLLVIRYTNPDAQMRDTAQEMSLKIQAFWIDNFTKNRAIYECFKAYVEGNAQKEKLSSEQRYFLDEEMKGFKRAGLDLEADKREKVVALFNELSELSTIFNRNIADDMREITVHKNGLDGIDTDTIASFKHNSDGTYALGIDYPTYFTIMENCTIQETRKQMYRTFNNRAYPINESILKEIIAKRDTLAKLLGYKSYAHYEIEAEMAETPDTALTFINNLITKAQPKEDAEIALFKTNLPASITLSKDGKFQPWDLPFCEAQYKKKHLAIDEEKIAEYFPMQNTIDELLDIYHQFLGVTFKKIPLAGFWHNDVEAISVFKNEDLDNPIGYLMLDLFPRPNKYSHACHITVVPGILAHNMRIPDVSVVLANFKKPTDTKPSLLKRSEVKTFFHEFGHAIHALLGATEIPSFSGPGGVKTDFVEMPSQMLEEWLDDPHILKKVSKHYITGEPLADDLIKSIVALKNFDTGSFVCGQGLYAQLSLDCFGEGIDKDPQTIYQILRKKLVRNTEIDDQVHKFTSFGHLTGYGSKYYGYLWSKVFALDMFEQIEKEGLLNPVIGQKYIKTVIGRGGSAHPSILLRDFLGREPRIDTFIRRMGL